MTKVTRSQFYLFCLICYALSPQTSISQHLGISNTYLPLEIFPLISMQFTYLEPCLLFYFPYLPFPYWFAPQTHILVPLHFIMAIFIACSYFMPKYFLQTNHRSDHNKPCPSIPIEKSVPFFGFILLKLVICCPLELIFDICLKG